MQHWLSTRPAQVRSAPRRAPTAGTGSPWTGRAGAAASTPGRTRACRSACSHRLCPAALSIRAPWLASHMAHAPALTEWRLQICASYAHRRDLTAAAKVPGLLGRARPLTQAEACAQACPLLQDMRMAGPLHTAHLRQLHWHRDSVCLTAVGRTGSRVQTHPSCSQSTASPVC